MAIGVAMATGRFKMAFAPDLLTSGAVILAVVTMGSVATGNEASPKRDVIEPIASLQIGAPLPEKFHCAKVDVKAVETTHEFRRSGAGPDGGDLYLAVTVECLRRSCVTEGDLVISRLAILATPVRDPAPICPVDPSVRLTTARGLKLGDPTSRIEELFGKPPRIDPRHGRVVHWQYGGVISSTGFGAIGGNAPVKFVVTVECGRVLRIEAFIDTDPYEPPI